MAVELSQAQIASSNLAWQEASPPFEATTEGLVKFGPKMDMFLNNAQYSPVRVVFFATSGELPMAEVHVSSTESFSMPARALTVGLGMGDTDLTALKGDEVQELFDRCTLKGEPLYIEFAENGEVAQMLFDTDEAMDEWNWMKYEAKLDEEERQAMIDRDLQELTDSRVNDDLLTDDYTTPEAQAAIERDIQMAEAESDPAMEIWAQFDAREEPEYEMSIPKHSDYELFRQKRAHIDPKHPHTMRRDHQDFNQSGSYDSDRDGKWIQGQKHPYAQKHREIVLPDQTPIQSKLMRQMDAWEVSIKEEQQKAAAVRVEKFEKKILEKSDDVHSGSAQRDMSWPRHGTAPAWFMQLSGEEKAAYVVQYNNLGKKDPSEAPVIGSFGSSRGTGDVTGSGQTLSTSSQGSRDMARPHR
jgi:hypothetical protein